MKNMIFVTTLSIFIFAQPTLSMAKDMKCACYTPAVGGLEAGSKGGYKLKCNETYSQPGVSDVSVHESKAKIKVKKNEQIQSDSDMNMDIRPRDDGNCIWGVIDKVASPDKNYPAKGGSHCTGTGWKTYGKFKLTSSDGNMVAKFGIQTTKKTYGGTIIYGIQNGTKVMVAACLENK